MEIVTNELNKNKNVSTGRVNTMKLDEDSQAMVFQMFTGGLYSDPIGTVIREITSNCFDSHIEAGVDSKKIPVIVRLAKDVGSDYISFIDKGMGMSPYRVTKIYGTYFKSTKRSTNDQIGGFGLGGKTPLAYTESFYIFTVSTKQNEIDYCVDSIIDTENAIVEIMLYGSKKDVSSDNTQKLFEDLEYYKKRLESSSKITNPNVKYVYDIFEDTQQPAIDLMKLEGTDEPLGTEVRVPVRESDIREFEKKTLRQLYYFENVIFEGFNNYVVNDYKILKGKNFLFRGRNYDNRIHVCYGKVAYPLDYEAMNLDGYEHSLPIAIRLEIGELEGTGVTPSRESLKYSRENIKIIKAKINDAIEELKGLLIKQNENIITLEDYFKVRNNLGLLHLDDNVDSMLDLNTVINTSEVKLPKFKYSELNIPDENDLFEQLYQVNVYGAKPSRNRWASSSSWNTKFDKMMEYDNIYYNDHEFNRNVKKQGYLRYISSSDNFFIVTPYDISAKYTFARFLEKIGVAKIQHAGGLTTRIDPDVDNYEVKYLIPEKKAIKLVNNFRDDFHELVAKRSNQRYDDVEITEDYLQYRKNNTISKKVLEDGIPLKCYANRWSHRTERERFEKLVNFNGKIYYGFMDDSHSLEHAREILSAFTCEKYVKSAHRLKIHDGGILLIGISKANEKYMKLLGKKAIHVDKFYHTFISRKLDVIKQSQYVDIVENVFNESVHQVLKNIDVMEHVNEEITKSVTNIKKYIETANSSLHRRISNSKLDNIFNFKLIDDVKLEDSDVADELKNLIEISEKSSMKLRWINMPYHINPSEESHKELLSLLKMMIDK